MLVDSHCHLDYEPLNSSLERVVNRAKKVGVEYFLTICTNNKSFKKILNILPIYKSIYGTYGIHPHEAKHYVKISSNQIKEKYSENKKIIGVGETGLDFFYNNSDKDVQKDVFTKHINATQDLNSTLIVHSRSAENETFNILKREFKIKEFKILMHCFTGSKEFAYKLLDLGCYFSASGIVTFKNSNNLKDVFKSLPSNRILLETDSPYLSPEPVRGKTNEPSNLVHTLKFISNIRNQPENELAENTTKNFFRLFNLNNPL